MMVLDDGYFKIELRTFLHFVFNFMKQRIELQIHQDSLFIIMIISIALLSQAQSFTIYQMLFNLNFKDEKGEKVLKKDQVRGWYQDHGVQKMCIIYHNKMLNCTKSIDCDEYSIFDVQKIKSTSQAAKTDKCKKVMLDVECYDGLRFNPTKIIANGRTILGQLTQAAKLWKKYSDIPFGFYGEIPQTVFNKDSGYDDLMPKYKSLQPLVDYLSTAMYNYNYDGTKEADILWFKSLVYVAGWAKKLAPNKPFIPLMKPTWDDPKTELVYAMTYQQMYSRLQAIKELGGKGVIFWDWGAQVYLSGDKQPYTADTTKGWFKAVVDFLKKNNRRHH